MLGVAPNPAAAEQMLRFALDATTRLRIDLLDVNGRRVREVFAGEVAAGLFSLPVDVSDLEPGAYFYPLRGADGSVQMVRSVIGARP